MTITLYGIPNCDTMKKARVWLDQRGVEYRFHNYKADGIDEATLRAGSIRSVGKSCSTGRVRPFGNSMRLIGRISMPTRRSA